MKYKKHTHEYRLKKLEEQVKELDQHLRIVYNALGRCNNMLDPEPKQHYTPQHFPGWFYD